LYGLTNTKRRRNKMHVTYYQRVRLNYPGDYHMLADFENDAAWKCVGYGTSGSVWEKVISEADIASKDPEEKGEKDE
jgi:hypothetical protein